MYIAKERGKGRYQIFEPAMHDAALKRLELKADLRRAIEHHEYRLHYQPVVELENGRITGVEALIRWSIRCVGPCRRWTSSRSPRRQA